MVIIICDIDIDIEVSVEQVSYERIPASFNISKSITSVVIIISDIAIDIVAFAE